MPWYKYGKIDSGNNRDNNANGANGSNWVNIVNGRQMMSNHHLIHLDSWDMSSYGLASNFRQMPRLLAFSPFLELQMLEKK